MASSSALDRLLGDGPLARAAAPFALVEVTGPDAGDFLQRLCSQDVLGLADGAAAPAAFLDAKGKLLVTCILGRLGGTFWLELQAPQQPRLVALLERYHFTEKLSIAARDLGPCREEVAAEPASAPPRIERVGAAIRVAIGRRGVHFVRTHGAAPELPSARPLTDPAAEILRMAAGFVAVGIETEATTLALEADLADHCSATKGCYTGQEIVARIHTYGHTNRKVCFLELAAGAPITAAQPLAEPVDGLPVGRVLHALPLPDGSARHGLGYLPPDFQAPGTALRLLDGSAVTVLW